MQVNEQIQVHDITVKRGYHVDASITQSPRKPKTRPAYEVVSDREERDDEADAQTAMRIIEVTQPGVDSEARWVKKGGQSVFGYKQHTVVDGRRVGWRLKPPQPIAMTASHCWICSIKQIFGQELVFMLTRRIAAKNIALR